MTAAISVKAPALHEHQQVIFSHPARFKVLVAGRRFGKSKLASVMLLSILLRGGMAWWVLPTFDLAKRVGWATMTQVLKPLLRAGYVEANKSDLLMTFQNGGTFQVKSGDRPERLVGDGLDFVVIDECGTIHPDVWSESLRPALADKQGSALFVGTPKGRNWFWELFMRGNNPEIEGWQSWHFPTLANPYIAPSEIEQAKAQMPDAKFRQEFEAEFIEDFAGVFRNVRSCITDHANATLRNTVMGVDWGRHNDYTAIAVMDADTQQLIALDRFNQISWSLQRGRLKALADKYKPRLILAESNSIGEPNIEALQREGLPVQGFSTTASSKPPLIEALALAFESQRIGIIDNPVLIHELQAYEMERLPSGMFRYNAPSGGHDDTVIALALAYDASQRNKVVISNARRQGAIRNNEWWRDDDD